MTTQDILTYLDIQISILKGKQRDSARFENYGLALVHQAQAEVLANLVIVINHDSK